MRPQWHLLFMLCLLPSPLLAQSILMESALVLQAPGYQGVWPAWFDGDRFWLQAQPFMEQLGYEILFSDSTELTTRDRRRAITFDYAGNRIHVNGEEREIVDFAMVGSDGQMLITVEALQEAFGSDLVWDESGLILRLSSAASLFEPTRFSEAVGMEVPQNVLFPRQRTWLGGVHIGYSLLHEWHERTGRSFTPVARVAAHVAGGTVRWHVSRTSTRLVHYTLDFESRWLSRIEAGQYGEGLGVRVSNRPLHPRRVHREAVQLGKASPHAIVRGRVSGAISEQVQADREGRYAVRHPVFYGSTETTIEVEPLGADPLEVTGTHWLTPYAMLPQGNLEYNAQLSATPSGEIAWGMSSWLTLRAVAQRAPKRAVVRVHVLPLSTINMDAEVDLVERNVRGNYQWWRPWGGLDGEVQVRQNPIQRQLFSTNFTLAGGGGNLQVRLSHQQDAGQASRTSIRSILGWQFTQSLRVHTGVQFQSGATQTLSFTPRLTFTLPLESPRIHLHANTKTTGRQIDYWQGGALANGRSWSARVLLRRSMQTGALDVHGTFQVNTEWAWLDTRGGWSGGELFHFQALRGTIMIGEDIRFSALYEERTQAVIRLYVDNNLNGELDAGESLSLRHRVNIPTAALSHRANGEVVARNLDPYFAYSVSILPESIINPLLHPATGYQFAFVATPGRTRYLDIPLQPLPTVTGRLTNWPGSYTVLQVQLRRGEFVEQSAVYQDGVFIAQVLPGNYQVTVTNLLTGEPVSETDLTVVAGENLPVIALQQ